MGEPFLFYRKLYSEYIAVWRRPGEVKHLSSQRNKKKQKSRLSRDSIPLVAASERGTAQTNTFLYYLSMNPKDS